MKRLALLLLLAPATASAFPTGDQFDLDALKQDGGGGLAFTGSPRFQGHTCAVCHTGAPGKISLALQSDQPELFTDGWKPNTQYHLRVAIQNAWAAAQYTASGDNCGTNAATYHPCDENGFALEFDNAGAQPVGKLAAYAGTACATTPPMDPGVQILKDGTAVMHKGTHFGILQWDFCWTAPASGAGVITAYLAGVDGNGGDGTEAFPNDTTGDDVAAGAVPISEHGIAPSRDFGGCDAGAGEGPGVGVLIALALWIARRRSNRPTHGMGRRRLVTLALLASVASLGGCVHVRPRQRGTLAHRNMKFSPDPAEDELDLHMQESREGSSGGYGSSGGGCGCN
jgi:hypothetical protein